MAFGWGIVSTGKHPDIKIAPAMAAADGGDLVEAEPDHRGHPGSAEPPAAQRLRVGGHEYLR